jgi:hypothetical protein
LLCATIGTDAVGSALAAGKSLLLITNRPTLDLKSPGPACRGFLFASSSEWNRPQRSLNFHWNHAIGQRPETFSIPVTWFGMISLKFEVARSGTCYE